MEIYIARDGQRFGPFPLEEVQRQLASGQLMRHDLAWVAGARDWMPLSAFPPLQSTQQPFPGAAPVNPIQNPYPVQPLAGFASPLQSTQTSGAAIASLILGILSLVFCPIIGSISAIICGHVARNNVRQSRGTLSGGGIALAGLILGYVGMLPGIFFFMIILDLVFGEIRDSAQETKSLANARQIATACIHYAQDHNDRFPEYVDELIPKYLPDRKLFSSPLSPGRWLAYEYYGGSRKDPADRVLLMSLFRDDRGRRVIVHVDGSGVVGIPPRKLPRPLRQ